MVSFVIEDICIISVKTKLGWLRVMENEHTLATIKAILKGLSGEKSCRIFIK